MSNDYQKVCELEASGDVGQSVVFKVKLPQGRAALRRGFGVMMAVRMRVTLVVVVIIAAVVIGWCLW